MRQTELERLLHDVKEQVARPLGLNLTVRLVDWQAGNASEPYFEHVYYLGAMVLGLNEKLQAPMSEVALAVRAVDDPVGADPGWGQISAWAVSKGPAMGPFVPLQPEPLSDEQVRPHLEGWLRALDAARRLQGEERWGSVQTATGRLASGPNLQNLPRAKKGP